MKDIKFKQLRLKQLSDSVANKTLIHIDQLAKRLKEIRQALGLTQKQLAKRLNVTRQEIGKIEKNIHSPSLKTLTKVAAGLNCQIFGAIVSETSLEKMIQKQAEKKADKMIKRMNNNMAMEKQALDPDELEFQKTKLINEFIANTSSALWED